MKKTKVIMILCVLAALFAILSVGSSAADMVADVATIRDSVYFMADAENSDTVIYPQKVGEREIYLFLPSSADLSALTLRCDEECTNVIITGETSVDYTFGEEVDILALFGETQQESDSYKVTVVADNDTDIVVDITMNIMKSANVRTMYIVSEDPVKHGRDWVDSVKDNEAEGHMSLLNAQGETDYTDELTEVKARGNSTFTDFVKKAYQIKIKNKTNLIGDENDVRKKWILLANAADITFLHNALAFTLADELNMPYNHDTEHIDLYYDGEYRGTYQLTDKVEVDETGVDIQDHDKLIEKLNEDTPAYDDPVVSVKTRKSNGTVSASEKSAGTIKYVENLVEPELEEGTDHFGYLLEVEFIYRYPNELSGFVTDRGQAIVTKNPEYLTKNASLYISNFFQEFEDAVFSEDGYNKETGKYYYEYCDLESLVNLYLINEFSKNYDTFRSSTFFYLPEDEDIMYAGPLWDYDLSFGTGYDGSIQHSGDPENFWAATKYMCGALLEIESFRDAVKATLNKENGEFYKAAETLLGENGYIAQFASHVYTSQKLNCTLWPGVDDKVAAYYCNDEETYENSIKYLYDFVEGRLEYLSEFTSEWNGDNYSVPLDPVKGEWALEYRYHANIEIIEAIPATCTEDGWTQGSKCLDCGKVFSEPEKIEKTGHDWLDATCSEPSKCANCGIENEDKTLGEHTWVKETCVSYRTCSACGLVDEESGLAEHVWLDATCTSYRICLGCGMVDEEYGYAEHTWTDATCKEYATCQECGAQDVEGGYADHDWTEATCTKPATCKVCGETTGEKLPHAYEHAEDDDRNSDTQKVYICKHCGDTFFMAVVPAVTGDLNGDGVVTAADARIALRYAAGLDEKTDEIIALADLNGDKLLTAADARLILRKAAKLDE